MLVVVDGKKKEKRKKNNLKVYLLAVSRTFKHNLKQNKSTVF